MERLIHSTANNDAVYKRFDKEFYKFPSYLKRDAINTSIELIGLQNCMKSGLMKKKTRKSGYSARGTHALIRFLQCGWYKYKNRLKNLEEYMKKSEVNNPRPR